MKMARINESERGMLEQRKGYENSAIGILNVSIEDITLDVPDEVKGQILGACNECSVMGRKHNIEYATLLDAKTGEFIGGYRLKAGSENSVRVAEWAEMLKTSDFKTLWAVHNHTNGTPFSTGDIKFLIWNDSVAGMFLASGRNMYYMAKDMTLKPELANIVNDIRRETELRFGQPATLDTYNEILAAALRKNGIKFERW